MKNIEQIKDRINNTLKFGALDEREIGFQLAMQEVLEKLNQLDEPEVLSQEWIDAHTYHEDEYDFYYMDPDEVKEVLVPKQELPVIPKFVAEWIEEVKPDNSLRVAFEYIAQRKRNNHDDELAFWVEEGNSETFARAWLDGFTVEEEQKYYVIFKQEDTCTVTLNKNGGIGTIFRTGSEIPKSYQLTEQEIKDYDERFWPFAVKVEELEE